MSYALESFHFNPRKAAQIIQQLRKDRQMSQSSLAAKTGISYDTVGNVISGKVQNISFETVFKFCVVLEVPIEVFMLLMLKDEDIDFEDRILLYDLKKDEVTPASDVDTSQVPSSVPESVAIAAEAVAATDAAHADVRAAAESSGITYSTADISRLLDRIERLHAEQISQLIESRKMMCDQYERQIAAIRDQYQHECDMAEKHHAAAQQLIMQLVSQK